MITSCTLGAHVDHSRYKVWRPKPLPMVLLASLASVTTPCAGPLLFFTTCRKLTLCYQRFTHTHTRRQTDRQTDRQTHTQTHTHTDTHTHTRRHTHTHIHMQTHTHRHTHTHADTHTHTQTHVDTHTHTHADTRTRRHTGLSSHGTLLSPLKDLNLADLTKLFSRPRKAPAHRRCRSNAIRVDPRKGTDIFT